LILAGHQPNYLPWLGFFEKIRNCDVFLIADNIQYEHQGFTNRNRIKNAQGAMWLTVPVEHMGRPMCMNEVRICNVPRGWAKRHWLSLKFNYCKAPFWEKYCGFFEQTYSQEWALLIDLNMHLIRGIMEMLNIEKPFVMASSMPPVSEKKSEGLLAKCKAFKADTLLSGVGARSYIVLKRFEEEGIKVVFQDFQYAKYPQLYGEFIPNLSVVDYLFCTGGNHKEANDLPREI